MLPLTAHFTLPLNNGDSFPASEAAPSIARLKDAQVRFGMIAIAVRDLHIVQKQVVGDIEVPAGAGNLLISVQTTPNFIQLAPE